MTGGNLRSKGMNDQTMTKSIVVFDSEWTTWEGALERRWSGPGEEIEIVQIGMAKLADTAELPEIDHIEFFIHPVLNPDLSAYFTELTGITQRQVDEHGISYSEALEKMQAFLDPSVQVVYCFGGDGIIVSRNCTLNNLEDPFPPELFASIRGEIAEFLGIAEEDALSSRLPQDMGFDSPGDAHTALADARCIGEALRIMRRASAF
jgi:inhibitor of KinA sporulation pathway (predicted exonuclease)